MNTIRWLRNHREIARFLELKRVSPKRLREIGEWIARADFPKKQKKGFVGSEVQAWYLRFASEEAARKAPLIAARQILEQGRVPGKRGMEALEAGSIEPPSGEVGGGQRPEVRGQSGNPGPIPSQAAMAVELQLRYALPIKRQTIHNWITGIHLPKGAPRFPLTDPNRHGWNNPQPCYEWYEKWIVDPLRSAHAGDAVQGNLFEQKKADAIMAEFEEQIDKARKMKTEADAAEREISDKWIARDVARATGARVVGDILVIVEAEYERGAPGRRREKLAGLVSELVNKRISELGAAAELMNSLTHELTNSFSAWDLEDERARIDRIRAACAGKAVLTTDKTG